ncbi:hypothetical protein FKW77_002086 [Venturia effusa]|uniref:RGS domain-containing protein n=1 Tax=Venturia effusa TaxID=50376 RepID=A0A517LPP1_9PEZI|nr:hypothetical protein FKW77_002086 [Venturia effusa]
MAYDEADHAPLVQVSSPTKNDLDNAMVGEYGTSLSEHANLDRLGQFYIGFAIIYTVLVFSGLIALFIHRQSHAVRIRSFKTICTTVLTLHIYLVLILMAYPLNGLYKCWMEFWIMNIILPLGIALFQGTSTSNMRLFSYAMEQKEISHGRLGVRQKCSFNFLKPKPLEWARHRTIEQRTYGLIVVGVIVQTRLSIAACLPGTPLWLAFIYTHNPHLVRINQYFKPAGWFLPGLITMQFVSIWFPLLDIYKLKSLEKKFGENRSVPENPAELRSFHDRKLNPYSMATLELQLEKNPNQLMYWAYTKEFTAENILFLTAVRGFKRKWSLATKQADELEPARARELYEEAAMIFFTMVHPVTAHRNINIDSATFRELEDLFKSCQYDPDDGMSGVSKSSSQLTPNIVAPWEELDTPERSHSALSDRGKLLDDHVIKLHPLPVTQIQTRNNALTEDASATIVPTNFTIEIYDRAYESVKDDVYLNTWVRLSDFVGIGMDGIVISFANFLSELNLVQWPLVQQILPRAPGSIVASNAVRPLETLRPGGMDSIIGMQRKREYVLSGAG